MRASGHCHHGAVCNFFDRGLAGFTCTESSVVELDNFILWDSFGWVKV